MSGYYLVEDLDGNVRQNRIETRWQSKILLRFIGVMAHSETWVKKAYHEAKCRLCST